MFSKFKPPVSVFLLLCVLLVIFISNQAKNTNDIPEATYGAPVVYLKESELSNYSIHQIVDDGTYIYLLIDDHKGIVQVYDTDGNYQKSIAFYSHLNGAFRIAISNGMFYVCDKQGNLYQFRDGEFMEFLSYKDGELQRKSIDFESNSLRYYVRSGSVWVNTQDGSSCIIKNPTADLQLFNHVMNIGLFAICIIVFVFKHMSGKHKIM